MEAGNEPPDILCFVCKESNGVIKFFNTQTLEKCSASLMARQHFNLKYSDCVVPEEVSETVGYHTSCYSTFNALKAKHRLPKQLST